MEPTRQRVVIQAVTPEVDAGRFPAKRVVGDELVVEADVYTDGHDEVAAAVRHRQVPDGEWREVPMTKLVNDRWSATLAVDATGPHEYTVEAWVDRIGTWLHDLDKRVDAGNVTHVDLLIGADLLDEITDHADDERDIDLLARTVTHLRDEDAPLAQRVASVRDPGVEAAARRHDPRRFVTTYHRTLPLWVDRELAGCSAWYELFPRSTGAPGEHGTLKDVEEWLPYVADMGFDVLYLPPIHPIGRTARKGRNNLPAAEPTDVGSPWAIGGEDGGHKSVHPELGTVEDLEHLVGAARDHGLELALDIAFQCSPDHPYVKEHPEWFRARPDGTIQYAENPPKKYQDIYPFDFECDAYESLWEELESIIRFWMDKGVRVFRVDNPHTKSLRFWEWCIDRIHATDPDVLFLSEAFTRPKVMYDLAKRGFTHGYTYFTWRRSAWELEEYFRELTAPPAVEFFRPNAWPNTPDILPDQLQYGGRGMFLARFVLAATLSSNYGIYGPAFELMAHEAREPGSEEYRDSEKYQLREWDVAREDSLAPLIARVNRIRRSHPALHRNRRLQFHHVDSDGLIAYSKSTPDHRDVVLVVVNTDPYHQHGGWVHLDMEALGLEPDDAFELRDMLGERHFRWHGAHNYVELSPELPAHVFHVVTAARTEQDFPYFV